MALIVEDGTGKSDAESFVSLADADDYFTKYGEPAETALRMGTQYIEVSKAGQWEGKKRLSTQALAWPRNEVYDESGYLVLSNTIPSRLKQATCEAALEWLKRKDSGGLLPTQESSGTISRERIKLGDLEEEIEYMSPKGQQIEFFKRGWGGVDMPFGAEIDG